MPFTAEGSSAHEVLRMSFCDKRRLKRQVMSIVLNALKPAAAMETLMGCACQLLSRSGPVRRPAGRGPSDDRGNQARVGCFLCALIAITRLRLRGNLSVAETIGKLICVCAGIYLPRGGGAAALVAPRIYRREPKAHGAGMAVCNSVFPKAICHSRNVAMG